MASAEEHTAQRKSLAGSMVKLLCLGAAMIVDHALTRTTQLYDRRNNEVSLDEVERILI
jgi:hypothetical protein